MHRRVLKLYFGLAPHFVFLRVGHLGLEACAAWGRVSVEPGVCITLPARHNALAKAVCTRGLTASQQNTRRFRGIGVYPTPETLNRFQFFLGSTAKLRARLQDYCGPDRVAGDGERFLRTPLSLHQRQAPIGILRSRPKENISAWAASTL